MNSKTCKLDEFLAAPGTIIDVRTPAEFLQGKICDAINIPLFSNEERAKVGTVYKKVGKEAAIQLGLKIVGPKLADLVITAKKQTMIAKVYCWRGGMRSSSFAWLLNLSGMETITLNGGYKTFRRWVLSFLKQLPASKWQIQVLGGMTGCGKTDILQEFKRKGAQVIDLEGIACHKGSSFGKLGIAEAQPSNEQFENEIALQWSKFDSNKPIWVEDESRLVGTCKIPNELFKLMKEAPLYFIEKPIEERLDKLCQDYSMRDDGALITAVERISKRLGKERAKQVIDLILIGQMRQAVRLVLDYYDPAYLYSIRDRNLKKINAHSLSIEEWAHILLNDDISTSREISSPCTF